MTASINKSKPSESPPNKILHAIYFALFYIVSYFLTHGAILLTVYILVSSFSMFHNWGGRLLFPVIEVTQLPYLPVTLCNEILASFSPGMGIGGRIIGLMFTGALLGCVVSMVGRLSRIKWKTWIKRWIIWVTVCLLSIIPLMIYVSIV